MVKDPGAPLEADDALAGVMVCDRMGRAELRHRHCVAAGERIDGNEQLPPVPERGD